MSTPISERPSALPFALAALVLFMLVYLVRAPSVYFWNYTLGMAETDPSSTAVPGQPVAQMKLPAVPAQMSTRWSLPATRPITHAIAQDLEAALHDLRAREGKPSLLVDAMLRDVARYHSHDMYQREYLAHVSPEGVDPDGRVSKLYRTAFGLVGENIASRSWTAPTAGLVEGFMEGWWNSTGHRRNMLSEQHSHTATACYGDDPQQPNGKMYCTQLFFKQYGQLAQPLSLRVQEGKLQELVFVSAAQHKAIRIEQHLYGLQSSVNITHAPVTGGGQFSLAPVGPPGVYRLFVVLTTSANPGMVKAIPGPVFVVE